MSMPTDAHEHIDGHMGDGVDIYLTQMERGKDFVTVEVTEESAEIAGSYNTRSVSVWAKEFFDAVRRLELERK